MNFVASPAGGIGFPQLVQVIIINDDALSVMKINSTIASKLLDPLISYVFYARKFLIPVLDQYSHGAILGIKPTRTSSQNTGETRRP
jgi:hypothetical protein